MNGLVLPKLAAFKKDSINFLQRKRRIDSLQHIIDSLEYFNYKALVYQRKIER